MFEVVTGEKCCLVTSMGCVGLDIARSLLCLQIARMIEDSSPRFLVASSGSFKLLSNFLYWDEPEVAIS